MHSTPSEHFLQENSSSLRRGKTQPITHHIQSRKKFEAPSKCFHFRTNTEYSQVFHPQANHTSTQLTVLLETTDTREEPDTHKLSQMTSFVKRAFSQLS